MKRREFFKNTSLGLTSSAFILPGMAFGAAHEEDFSFGKGKKAKNIIFMVSDGMSTGTLNMADVFLKMKEGRGSHWLNLYRDKRVNRGLMDMASASSIVTDSAAASSSWGGGVRVKNGRLNVGDNDEEFLPILQKFKKTGKKVGCVTTVPITHATPAGFCTNSKSRGDQEEIAKKYLDLRFDVMMGGGGKFFNKRKDERDLFAAFAQGEYYVVNDKVAMAVADNKKPLLGVFSDEALPYDLDRINDAELASKVPTLAEMTKKAIELMKDHKKGFVMQVEGGKVDWAAHANDAAGLIYDQVAFDEAIKVAIEFAEKDRNTLVVLTSDHGNSNPGLYYGDKANKNFEKLFSFKYTNNWILTGHQRNASIGDLAERIQIAQGYVLTDEQLHFLNKKYLEQSSEGTYNEYKLPYRDFGIYQSEHTSVAFGGIDHSADFTELAMFGPGSERMKPFMRNTDIHSFLLEVAEVENKF